MLQPPQARAGLRPLADPLSQLACSLLQTVQQGVAGPQRRQAEEQRARGQSGIASTASRPATSTVARRSESDQAAVSGSRARWATAPRIRSVDSITGHTAGCEEQVQQGRWVWAT